jgi:ketosteroid isomerase-like protein
MSAIGIGPPWETCIERTSFRSRRNESSSSDGMCPGMIIEYTLTFRDPGVTTMRVSPSDRAVVENLFMAMQAGPAGEAMMTSLFHDDAVFVEPFSGQPITHTGKKAIQASFAQQTAHPLPDMKLTLDRLDVEGSVVRAQWTCTSSAFPKPMSGHDLFTIHDGKIARLEIVVTPRPDML